MLCRFIIVDRAGADTQLELIDFMHYDFMHYEYGREAGADGLSDIPSDAVLAGLSQGDDGRAGSRGCNKQGVDARGLSKQGFNDQGFDSRRLNEQSFD